MHKLLVVLGAVSLLAGCFAPQPQGLPSVLQTSMRRQTASQQYIYVTQYSNNSLTKFTIKGEMVWSITTGLASPEGVTIDANGKIYVANGNDTVTTYRQNGKQTTPTISTGLNLPFGIAVDGAGKVYVTNLGNDTVTTYTSDGTRTKPTIHGLDGVGGIAVDANGKIYVVNSSRNSVTTYKPNGKPTEPIITRGLHQPVDVKVGSSGKIWVSSYKPSAITSYGANGKEQPPKITDGLDGLYCIALLSDRIYAANRHGDDVTQYTIGGKPIPRKIDGLDGALTGIAVH